MADKDTIQLMIISGPPNDVDPLTRLPDDTYYSAIRLKSPLGMDGLELAMSKFKMDVGIKFGLVPTLDNSDGR